MGNAFLRWALAIAVGTWTFGCEDGIDGDGDDGPDAGMRPDGEPIEAEALTWTWIDFPESRCRDGSPSAIGVNLNPDSSKVMIFLAGGGACYNNLTCGMNPSQVDRAALDRLRAGVFDRTHDDNPVADWNFVYIPYCTGDVHAGGNPEGDPGIGSQQFVGYHNMALFLDRIVPTFPDATQVLHTGVSAGGFGASLTVDLVQRSFGPNVPITLINDSGPSMSRDYLPTCLQAGWRELWGFDETALADCGSACPDPDDYSVNFAQFLATKYDRPGGLISSLEDGTIRLFYGFGADDCTASFGSMPAEEFRAGLEDFRDRMQDHAHFGTFFIPGSGHTWIGGDSLYTTTVNGVRLVDWFGDIVDRNTTTHVAP